MKYTQAALAARLGVQLPSVGRWETTEPPSNVTLARLYKLASDEKHADLAKVFYDALEDLKKTQWTKANDILDEIERWHEINDHLYTLGQIDSAVRRASKLVEAFAAIEPMYDTLVALQKQLARAQQWSWRNR